MAFHLALLVDSLLAGNYVPVWRDQAAKAFQWFLDEVAKARLAYRTKREVLIQHAKFIVLLGGSGSDTADVIRTRHAFFLQQIYSKLTLKPLDPKRLFDTLEKEVIWVRDRRRCQSPDCGRSLSFAEARIHHIDEHCTGGLTKLENGVLVCPECHGKRQHMQTLATAFQSYIKQITAQGQLTPTHKYV